MERVDGTGVVTGPPQEISNNKVKSITVKTQEKKEYATARELRELKELKDLNLKEIGQVLRVTESRVSQLHAQAVQRLRAKLQSTLESGEVELV